MVLPQTVDAEIFARITLAYETGFFEQADRGGVGRNACRFEPMQPQRVKTEWDQRLHGASHQAAARERLANPIAETARLSDAAADVGERQPADQRVVALAKKKKRIGRVGALVLGITAQPAPEGAAAQVIGRPGRLP